MSNSFDNLFGQQGPTLAEATSFFLKLKTAADDGLSMSMGNGEEAAPGAATDSTQEGIFAAPVEQVLQLMSQMVQNEFKTMYAYKVYAESLKGPEHFAIAQEFSEHAENELEHAEFLLRRMAVLGGGPVTVPNVPAPPPMADPLEIIPAMIEMEEAGIANWRTLLSVLGDNPTKYTVEGFLTRELEHLDELWQMLPAELSQTAGAQAETAGAPAQQQTQGGEQQNPAASQAPAAGGAPPMGDVGPKFAAALGEKLASSHIQIRKEKAWGDPDKGGAAEIMDDFIKRASAIPEVREKYKQLGLVARGAHKEASVEADPMAKAKQRGEANVVAHAAQTRGERGELHGDLVGRILGTGAGWKAGKTLAGKRGAPLATVAAAGLGSMLGGHAGRQIGREMDAAKHASFMPLIRFLSKIAFDDRLNMLPQEQAAEQAQQQNESQFFSQKAQEHAARSQQLEASLQEATQKAQEQEQAISEMQQTMSANSQAASSATTQAMLQAVSANTEAIKQRQLASNTTQGLMSLKDQLRQLADGPDTSGGMPGGAPGASPGGSSDGDSQGQGNPAGAMQGPAGAAPQSQESASTVAPGGEQAGAAPTASPEQAPNQMPASQGGISTPPQGKMGSLLAMAEKWASIGAQLKAMGSKIAPQAAGAVAGGLATGGAALAKSTQDPAASQEAAQALDEENKPGYMGSLGRAKAHSAAAFQEVLHKHPVAGSLAAAVPGALVGARTLPGAVRAGKKTIENVQELRKVEG